MAYDKCRVASFISGLLTEQAFSQKALEQLPELSNVLKDVTSMPKSQTGLKVNIYDHELV